MYYIYKIENIINGMVYIGRTSNYKERFTNHKSKLRRGKHGNKFLQKEYIEYGVNNFTYNILEETDSFKKSLELEERYVDLYRQNGLSYNIMGGGKIGLSTNFHPLYGKSHSDETKSKISNSKKGKIIGEDNHFYGKTHTEETKSKISESRKGKSIGGDNPYSKKVCIYGVVYNSVKEGRETSGLARYSFDKRMKDPNNNDFRYVE